MEIFDNCVQYTIPECSKVIFTTPRNSNSCLNLVEGVAELDNYGALIQLKKGKVVNLMQLSKIRLYSSSSCVFTVRGDHDVHETYITANQQKRKQLFNASCRGSDSYFVLQKGVLLHILVGDVTDVSLTLIYGTLKIFGCPLVRHKEYGLPPYSTVLMDNFATERCSFRVNGTNRRIKISVLKDKTGDLAGYVLNCINLQPKTAMLHTSAGPKILVVGPKNAGKTSFCISLLNEAIAFEMKTLYINLDVFGNINTLPGTFSIFEVEHRRDITGSFLGNIKTFLFGHTDPRSHLAHYYLLVRRVSEIIEEYCKTDYIMQFSSTLIEMCGSLCEVTTGEVLENINKVIKLFRIDTLVVIGTSGYHEFIKERNFTDGVKVLFINQSENIEFRNMALEAKIRDYTFKKYFYGTKFNPLVPKVFEVNFDNIQIYKIICNAHRGNDNFDLMKVKIDDVSVVPIAFDKNLLHCVFGVSEATSVNKALPVAEVKYFVSINNVDIEKRTITILSPNTDSLYGAILMMGDPLVYGL